METFSRIKSYTAQETQIYGLKTFPQQVGEKMDY